MGFGTSVIVAQIYWLNGQRDAVGSIPYNVSAAQNTEKSGHSLPFYGFQFPATFAKIPTCAPPEKRGVRTLTMVVLAVANVV